MQEELSVFVRDSLAKGQDRESITAALKDAGWPEDQIDAALAAYSTVTFPVPVPAPRAYGSAREAFLFLLLFTALYASVSSVLFMAFEAIDWFFPTGNKPTAYEFLLKVRWSIAYALISFPAFLVLSRLTHRWVGEDPRRRTSRLRKWLTYLTLFLAAVMLAGDLVTFVAYFLGGEMTIRFVLKILIVGATALLVLGHYLAELRGADDDVAPEEAGKRRRFLAALALGLVVAVIVSVFSIAASPWLARKVSRDSDRVDALRSIARELDWRWSSGLKVPADLETLAGERNSRLHDIRDPKSGELYEYRSLSDDSVEICAIFETDIRRSPHRMIVLTQPSFWNHDEGRECFVIEQDHTRE